MTPKLRLKKEYFCDIFNGISIEQTESGSSFNCTSYVYHPAFTTLRDWLSTRKYIETQRWHNGDEVLIPFYLNDHYFNVGDKFPSPTSLLWIIENET